MLDVSKIGSPVRLVVATAVAASVFGAMALPAVAQGTIPDDLKGKTVIASGLRQPRQLTYTSDGTLYIAESGLGGDAALTTVATKTVQAGLTSRISMVSPDGKQSVALDGLPSTADNPQPNFQGAFGLYVTDSSFWVSFGEGPSLKGRAFPLFQNVVEIDRKTTRIKRLVDTYTPAVAANQPSADDPWSNPTDFAVAKDGTVYIADASCNCVWSWTEKGGLKMVAKWDIKDNPVSDSVAIGPDGDLYVGMLTGYPFKPGTARIERWSSGKLKQKYEGLSMVTDVLVTKDGDVYASEYAEFGDKGPKPASGKVVMFKKDGKSFDVVMDGLTMPYGLAQNPKDGSIVLAVYSAGDKDGKGAVIKVK